MFNISCNPTKKSIEINLNYGKWQQEANALLDRTRKVFKIAIQVFDRCRDRLDHLPCNRFQNSLDQFYARITHWDGSPTIKRINTWIDSDGNGPRIQTLSLYVLKLPLRSARNVLKMIYNICKIAQYTLVHPWNALELAAQGITQFVHSLSNPEVLAQMGASTIGASLGQLMITGQVRMRFLV